MHCASDRSRQLVLGQWATLLVPATPADGMNRLVPYRLVRYLNDSKQ